MRTTLPILLILVLVAGMLIGCKPADTSVKISDQDAGKTIELKTGDTLEVALEGNLTTGFTWVPASLDAAVLAQIGEAESTPASDQLGSPGKIVLKFVAGKQGQTTLHLDYKRPWETGVAPEQTYEVTVVVKP